MNTKHFAAFLGLGLVALPLEAVKKAATVKPDNTQPVAAAATSAPRKVSAQSFLLNRAALDVLQPDDAEHADPKQPF
ncbi:MAG: hypothetical protein ACPG7U_04895 [Holosporaceae bacterium]